MGDGGANADSVSQWCTGSALARQVTDLRSAGAGGWALYRYGSLFRSDESGLAAAERAALTALDEKNSVYYGIMQKYRIFHLLFLRIEKHE